MAVIINDMDMPKNCIECGLRYREGDFRDYLFRCKITDNRLEMSEHERDCDCPLKLIDGLKDKINFLHKRGAEDGVYVNINDVFKAIDKYCKESED